MTFLEQFKLEIQKLSYKNIDELSNVAMLNTPTYQGIIRFILGKVIEEAELNNLEAQYLVEIRKQWQLHLVFLDTLRKNYDNFSFKKLPRPKKFLDIGLPAYLELKGSVKPEENKLISYDEQQNIYWQYLLWAELLEGAMISVEICLCEELDVKTNFEQLKDTESGEVYTDCKLGNEFMIDLVFTDDSVILKEIKEAEAFIRGVLDPIYTNANKENYEWLVKSILAYPFPGKIKIPNIDISSTTFSLIHTCTNEDLYVKMKHIKNNICHNKTGRIKYLVDLLLICTHNLEGKKHLKEGILLNNI